DEYAASFQTEGAGDAHQLVLCGDMNVARSDLDVHPKERKPRAIGQLPEERALIERILSRGLVDLGRTLDPNNDRLFTWSAPWRTPGGAELRVAPRLCVREQLVGSGGDRLPRPERGGNQRPCACAGPLQLNAADPHSEVRTAPNCRASPKRVRSNDMESSSL